MPSTRGPRRYVLGHRDLTHETVLDLSCGHRAARERYRLPEYVFCTECELASPGDVTPEESIVLRALREWWEGMGRAPSWRELAMASGLGRGSVRFHVSSLARKGRISLGERRCA